MFKENINKLINRDVIANGAKRNVAISKYKTMKLKVCGMRDARNITELIKLQPDFMGFIFHKKSPRNVSEISNVDFPKTIKKVGVFVDKEELFIREKVLDYGLDVIQLHGNETPKECQQLKMKEFEIIKAFQISEDFDFEKLSDYEPFCNYFLFDAFGKDAGGNGITFNWNLLQKYNGQTPFLLSGGLDGTMTESILNISHDKFAGIDINSGFEIAPALKDIEKIKKFKQSLQR